MRKWLWTIPPWTLTVVARWMMNLRFCWIKIHVYFWCREIELIQFSSVSQSCPTLCEPMDCSTPGLPVHHSNHLILCHPLLLLPSIFLSIRVFSNESALCIRWSRCWSYSFNIRTPRLISFKMDWLDLLAVQRILKSLLQHHSSKASILQRSAFFIIQLTSLHDH